MENVVSHRPGLFFVNLGPGKTVYLRYSVEDGVMILESTYTPDEYRGMGLAGKITEKAVTYAMEHGLKIKPVCSYSVQFFQKHKEYKELLG
ncbi:MAG TPA: GNAT family N-acetyltransferase [Candidatus Bathyarchaeia archaeon]|nr:GNAT family N-acetyltransferase [Candidatus Bathyarchaeia archaeon]